MLYGTRGCVEQCSILELVCETPQKSAYACLAREESRKGCSSSNFVLERKNLLRLPCGYHSNYHIPSHWPCYTTCASTLQKQKEHEAQRWTERVIIAMIRFTHVGKGLHAVLHRSSRTSRKVFGRLKPASEWGGGNVLLWPATRTHGNADAAILAD